MWEVALNLELSIDWLYVLWLWSWSSKKKWSSENFSLISGVECSPRDVAGLPLLHDSSPAFGGLWPKTLLFIQHIFILCRVYSYKRVVKLYCLVMSTCIEEVLPCQPPALSKHISPLPCHLVVRWWQQREGRSNIFLTLPWQQSLGRL